MKKHYDYLIPIIIFFVIFFNNLHPFMTLDYSYNITPPPFHLSASAIIYTPLQYILYPLHLLPYAFQIFILTAMLISYYYIKKQSKHPIMFAIIFFFNPFIYSRIMAGQLGVILSYLLLPVYIYFLFKENSIKLAIAFTLSSIFSIHFFLISTIIYIVYIIVFKKKIKIKFLLALLILNLYWLIPFLISNPIAHITTNDATFFAPKLSQAIPTVPKVMGMWGFWRESSYITSFLTFPLWLWYLLTFAMFIIMFLSRQKSTFFYVLWWIGLILAVGISHPLTKPIFDILFKHLPFFNGLRDSHKFVSLIALSYAYIVSKKKYAIAFILILIVYTYPLIGLWHQITPTQYPQDYMDAKNIVKGLNPEIIYIPWFDYVTYNWTKGILDDGRIHNPINKFNSNVLTNPGPWGKQTPLTINITKCLTNKSFKCLKKNNINYIVYDKSYKLTDHYFGWIKNSTKIYSKGCIDIYETN